MGSPADRRARLLEAVYRTWGEPAGWILAGTREVLTGIMIRRTSEEDVPIEYGSNSRASVERVVLRVRVAEVARPGKNDRIEVLGGDGQVIGAYVVTDRPQRVRFGMEWRVEVEAAS